MSHRDHLTDGPTLIPAWHSCERCRHFVKDAEIFFDAKAFEDTAAALRELQELRHEVSSLGLSLVRIQDCVSESWSAEHRPSGHKYIEDICNAALAATQIKGFQACNVCGDTPLPGMGRCFEHHPRTEQSALIKDLLHTAFSGLKGGFTLPDWWLPQVREAITAWDACQQKASIEHLYRDPPTPPQA